MAVTLGAAICALAVSGAVRPASAPQQAAGGGPASAMTDVLVCTTRGVEPGSDAQGRLTFCRRGARLPLTDAERAIAAALAGHRAVSITPAFHSMPRNRALAEALGLDRIHRIRLPADADAASLVARLRAFGTHIEFAEQDGIGGPAVTLPNDAQFSSQYALLNTGQTVLGQPGVAGADIGATNAWDLSTGSSAVRLAVLDTGASLHEDLAARLVPGWNVVDNNADTTSSSCVWHGTHVSGIAGAIGNNGIGIAGVDWNVEIMPVRVFADCTGSEADLADALIWATDNGADVINMSLQYCCGTTTLHNAVLYARGAGVVLVAAAGNFNQFGPGVAYPAKWPETIAVAATTNQDLLWSGSNQGPEVTIAAPGQDILSLNGSIGYIYQSGTSMATPHVSGLACLMLAMDPTLTHDEIAGILASTSVDLGVPGPDDSFGAGRIDALAALLEVQAGLSIPGDLDASGTVDTADVLILLAAWGACPLPPDPCPADLDGTDAVDTADLLILLSNWT